jgi:hypothetical protein
MPQGMGRRKLGPLSSEDEGACNEGHDRDYPVFRFDRSDEVHVVLLRPEWPCVLFT